MNTVYERVLESFIIKYSTNLAKSFSEKYPETGYHKYRIFPFLM